MFGEAPKNYYQFERDFKSLKNEREKLVQYLLNIKEQNMRAIFKSDLETDMLLAIFAAFFAESDQFFKDNSAHLSGLAKGLVSVKPFEMACEFLMDDEKDTIKKFLKKIETNLQNKESSSADFQ